MSSPADARPNARLPGAGAARSPKLKSLDLLAGYIGAGAGPQDLSANTKPYLTEALEHKLPLEARASASSPPTCATSAATAGKTPGPSPTCCCRVEPNTVQLERFRRTLWIASLRSQ